MLAYMNREALERTLATSLVHYWSRSRAQLWQKGETSGHIQHLRDLRYDCDADTLLVIVEQEVACHTSEPSCFFQRFAETPEAMPLPVSEGLLQQIYTVVQDRKRRAPQESYVASLMARGQDHVLKKVIEEAAEVLMASKDGRREAIVYEVADLWFHAIVALGWHDISLRKCSRNSSIVLENPPPYQPAPTLAYNSRAKCLTILSFHAKLLITALLK
jgi:phosphoribosyl-ATP pyrophosphohydrolase/phosphoribosyl-AMP cyclohydrolase